MENKINVANILKSCPKDMPLDSTMYDDVYFDYVHDLNTIHCYIQNQGFKTALVFNQFGTPNSNSKSKCVIFPKGKTTWKGFVPPCTFKDGDILTSYDAIFIYNGTEIDLSYGTRVIIDKSGKFAINLPTKKYGTRFANESEKQQLFNAIKDNGYCWNTETKTLDKLPKFKVGDIVKHKYEEFKDNRTITSYGKSGYWTSVNDWIDYENQDEWELVPNEFDITNLKPFDKVLVRDNENCTWRIDFYSHYEDNTLYWYVCVGDAYKQCIPYNEETANLVGTTNDCPNKYKTWKNK